MIGEHNNTPTKQIKNWLDESISKGTWKNYDDLHIDVLGFKSKATWLEDGKNSLALAKSLLNNREFIVTLDIRLKPVQLSSHINFTTFKEIQKEMAATPPSLYLYNRKWDEWLIELSLLKKIEIEGIEIFFIENKDIDNFYHRTITLF